MIDSEKLIEEIISKLDLIKESDIPSIDLYMDQVTTFMDTHLKGHKRFEDDKILTKTMINNYAKNDLLPSPEKKRYSKEHVIMLIFIYYFKNILSINDIKTLLAPISSKYFHNEYTVSLEDIYNEIAATEHNIISSIKEDILTKIATSKESFQNAPKEDQEFLQLFSLVATLSFDVYLKKQMIEGIVDLIDSQMINKENESKDSKSKESKSKDTKSKN